MRITKRLADHIEFHRTRLTDAPLATGTTPAELRRHLDERYHGFDEAAEMDRVFDDVTDLLWGGSEHASSPRHFGLTRPTVDEASVVADTLVSLYDPNLATWDFSPAAAEIERYTLDTLGARFGPGFDGPGSHFTSGGQEANHTAVAVALTRAFPGAGTHGLRALDRQPVMYLSEEGHHSFDKVAHLTGLGRRAVRLVPTTGDLAMDAAALRDQIDRDRADGYAPFLIVGTAGTINAGVIDPLVELAHMAEQYDLWFHVDAAWAGAVAVSDRLRPLLAGIERADSITCDAHKLLSTPVGAGMFFSRHPDHVAATFTTAAAYVPDHAADGRVYPYCTSMQWSRRFIGLKLFMMLAVRGMTEIARRIEYQTDLGDYLRDRLRATGWEVLNDSRLPVVCFSHRMLDDHPTRFAWFVDELKRRQVAWISKTILAGKGHVLRASVTNYESRRADIDAMVAGLEHLRTTVRQPVATAEGRGGG